MRRFSVSLLLFLASTCTFGQQAVHGSSGPEATRPVATPSPNNVPTVVGCPVGLVVERRFDFVTRLAADGHGSGPEQGLRISLMPLIMPRIRSAEITVYGVTSQASVVPLGGAASNEIAKTFLLHPEEVSKGLQEATVWMGDVGALTKVELKSLTYVDGSEWNASGRSRCSAVPSLFVLVGAK